MLRMFVISPLVLLVSLSGMPRPCSLAPSIVREICYWLLSGPHGGEIGVESVEGQGSTFWVRLSLPVGDPADLEEVLRPVRGQRQQARAEPAGEVNRLHVRGRHARAPGGEQCRRGHEGGGAAGP